MDALPDDDRASPTRVTAILKALDIARTIAWYEAAGFRCTGTADGPDGSSWCELARDGTVLQFRAGSAPWPGPPALTGTLYVHPASVHRAYEELGAGVTAPWGIEEREWGARELVLQDPDGYFVTFTEPISPGAS